MKTRDCSGKQKCQIQTDRTLTNYIMLAMGKIPVEIFEQYIITETVRYTQVQQNDNLFEMSEHGLKCYVGTLFLPGYHTLPQQDM